MIPNPDFSASAPADERLTELAALAGVLGFEIVDIAGFLDHVDVQSKDQLDIISHVQSAATGVLTGNRAVQNALLSVKEITDSTLNQVEGSVKFVRESGVKSQSVATWVKELAERMQQVASSLEAVEANNANISDIAKQVNILAINAKIEAARAGDSGRGFGVVAEAINELSKKTAIAAAGIEENISELSGWVGNLSKEATGISSEANHVIQSAGDTDKALTQIADGVKKTHDATRMMSDEADNVSTSIEKFAPAFEKIEKSALETANGIHTSHKRINKLIDSSESIFQKSVSLGGASEDYLFIEQIKNASAEVSRLFENGLETRRISHSDLFNRSYQSVIRSNPEQFIARFTNFTDDVLPQIQDAMLEYDPKVVFCAAIDPNGYLPTHNTKFSHPQSKDPEWNAANSRNRRIFNDRVGLKAGRNTDPFLMQVYRRDMGAGKFTMMKDLSAPIFVNGDHWGGLRLAYTF